MDVIAFRYLISLVVFEKRNIKLMDVVIAYLYEDLETKIYKRVPDELNCLNQIVLEHRTCS